MGRSSYAIGPDDDVDAYAAQQSGSDGNCNKDSIGTTGSSNPGKCVFVRGKSEPGVVTESRLHTSSKLRTNQYRAVRKEPLGKGWQSKVYLVEDTQVEGRPKYAMKVIETRKLNKITKKATDSNLWTSRRDETGRRGGKQRVPFVFTCQRP